MPPPANPFVRWNVSDLRGEFVGRALRQGQFKRGVVGGRGAQQRRIERAKRLHIGVDGFRHPSQIDGAAWFHDVGRYRRLRLGLYVVVRGILGGERQSDDEERESVV